MNTLVTDTKMIANMKLSDIHKILAVILIRVEKAGIEPSQDTGLRESDKENNLIMAVGKDTPLTGKEYDAIREALGTSFSVEVSGGRGKKGVYIRIEASRDEFLKLITKPQSTTLSQPTQPLSTPVRPNSSGS